MSKIFLDREKIPYLAYMMPSESFGLLDLLKGESSYYADRLNVDYKAGAEDKVLVHEGRGEILGFIAVFSSQYDDQLVLEIELDGMFQRWWENRFYEYMRLPTTNLALLGNHIHDAATARYGFYCFIPQSFREHCTVSLVNRHATDLHSCRYLGLWYALRR